jgi:hypothetical protein
MGFHSHQIKYVHTYKSFYVHIGMQCTYLQLIYN